MARRKFDDEPDNHDRWMVSYADFITLLFAFFVVMYAISSVNQGKYRVLSESLDSAFGKQARPAAPVLNEADPTLSPLRPRTAAPDRKRAAALRREREQLTAIALDLQKTMAPLVEQGRVKVTQTSRGITVEINASLLFAPGEARLNAESNQALIAVAAVMKNDSHAIQVEGHTDNLPIRNAYFPSNWELSAVRAGSVVRLFVEQGVAEDRLVALGYGATKPVESNDTAEGRLRNRRVQLMILSSLPEVATEVPVVER
ncbi:MAG: putative flagellar motor protein MotD [Herminiimonas sp.]|nr:putative flagellar motor protein MotD [Herminiimonas sp.]